MLEILYVGIDYHEKALQVCAMRRDGTIILNRPCPNDPAMLNQILLELKPAQIHAAIEACCGAAEFAEEISRRPLWSISLAHPGYVNRMKQTPDKTDHSDARTLADLTRVGYLPRVWLAPKPVRELRAVFRHRAVLVQQRRATKLRIGALLREQRVKVADKTKRWTQSWIEWLKQTAPLSPAGRYVVNDLLAQLDQIKQRIAQAETLLKEMTQDDPLVQRLMAMKAIGLITACALRAEVGRFDRFHNGKQLSHFCGLSPRNSSSGQRQGDAGLINTCSRLLRTTLIEAAHRLIRFDERWGQLAHRLRNNGKPAAASVASVANRWIRWLWHELAPIHQQAA